jgi:hypothetical protein
MLEVTMAKELAIKREHVTEFRKQAFEDGDVLTFGAKDDDKESKRPIETDMYMEIPSGFDIAGDMKD